MSVYQYATYNLVVVKGASNPEDKA